ncbi:MAG: exodeoxyribonuclease VII large subunit [Saprospiraceae bacterium]
MQSYTLFELNEYIRRVLALNLQDAIWITCEIAQINESRGNFYLELVQKSEEEETIIARSEGAIWATTYRQLKRKIGRELVNILQDGLEVKIQVRVSFHERYGLKLVVEDIDPTYTLGKLALQRQQTITLLEQEGLLYKNAQLALPIVLQRVAILSSPSAAGLQDFQNQLRYNPYGYHYQLQLFPTAMQGDQVTKEMRQQLLSIAKRQTDFDVVVIIRGGGARLDLQAFNEFELCSALANCPLPILTGIGHDIDETVADIVAFQRLKTPTAVADFLLQHNGQFENTLLQYGQQLQQMSQFHLQNAQITLKKHEQFIHLHTRNLLQQQNQLIGFLEQRLQPQTQQQLKRQLDLLDQLTKITELLSLAATLKRGYTLTTKNGKAITSTTAVQPQDEIETLFKDGKITSQITK